MEEISNVVKQELYAIEVTDNCLVPFFCGAVRGGGDISMIRTGYELSFIHSDREFVDLISSIVFRLTGTTPAVDETIIDDNKKYVLFIENEVSNDLLERCKIVRDRYTVVDGIPESLFGEGSQPEAEEEGALSPVSEAKRAFLRALYLSCGFLQVAEDIEEWNQKKTKSGYNLSLNLNSEIIRDDVVDLICEEAAVDRISVLLRKKRNGIYIKNSQAICNFLAAVGSNEGVLRLYEVITNRKMKNDMNRLQNFEMANIDKKAVTAARQIAAIGLVDKKIGIDKLPEGLKKVCEYRLQHEEASLEEIAAMFNPPVSKSCINHRMRKIVSLAEGKENIKE